MKIKPHFLDKTTEWPEYIIKREKWKSSHDYKIDLSLGHVIGRLLGYENYLVLNTGYGTLSEVLISLGKNVVSVDETDFEYDVLSENVQKTFRIADVLSPALTIKLFDNVVSVNFEDFETDDQLNLFVNFVTRHSNRYILLMYNKFYHTKDDIISYFLKRHFEYQEDLVQQITSLHTRLFHYKLFSTYIFKNLNPKDEVYG